MFYNPAMALDRDRNVAFVRAARSVGPPLARAWEMLAATGVRGLRLAVEAGPFTTFLLTEGAPRAVEVLGENLARLALPGVAARSADARDVPREAPFDYVDLDPYGTPMPYLDAALGALALEGLLAVTATDTRVLAGVDRGVAERRYGGRPLRGRLGPEGGLRLLLAAIARRAGERGRSITPRLAYVGSHHVRAFLTVGARDGDPPVGVIDPATWCGPPIAGSDPVGPLWLGPLFDARLVAALRVPEAAAEPRALARWIELVAAEARVDRPFFYESNTLARALRLPRPPATAPLLDALAREGYASAPTHARPGGFRTEAPHEVVVAVTRRLAAQPQNERVRA